MKKEYKNLRDNLLLYAITDTFWLKEGESLLSVIEEVLSGGATMLQYREKNLAYDEKCKMAREILAITKSYGIPLIINDDYEIAKKIGADGVHLGQSDIGDLNLAEISKEMIVGISVPNVKKAKEAELLGASYIGVNSSFVTQTKKDAIKADSIEDVRKIVESVNIPAVAIGGIDINNINLLKDTNIAGIAVVSAIFEEDDKKHAAEILLEEAKDNFRKDKK